MKLLTASLLTVTPWHFQARVSTSLRSVCYRKSCHHQRSLSCCGNCRKMRLLAPTFLTLSRAPFARLRQSWTTQRTRCSVASILTAFVNHAGFMCTLSFLLPSWKNKCCWCFLHSWLCDTFQLCSFCFFLRSNPFSKFWMLLYKKFACNLCNKNTI